ncbi:hypothetical protein HDU96_006791 [Phlyctochytrium bullatum]|nr:hypothetical protein HDU96_006791 [Phlyctochytrium bullatum]
MGFGGELWVSMHAVVTKPHQDQWRDVEAYAIDGVHFMMNINEFMKRRAEIEADYARNLQRLVKPYKDELAKKMSDKKAVNTENEAVVRSAVAEKLDTELRKTVKGSAKELDKKQKEKFDELKKALAELQKQVTSMEKLREKFESEKKSMETSKLTLDKTVKNPKSTEKEQDTLRLEVERKAATANSIMESYQANAAETNNLKNKEVQKEDENTRIAVMKTGLMAYYDLYSQKQHLLIKLLRTGNSLPPDYVFDEKVDDDDSIVSLPAKKGRKLAVDRVKALEKEQSELERKRQGVETLMSVYEQQATKDPKYMSDLQSQKASFDTKIDNLGLKKHRLQVYIAECDKTPPPELPANLVGKSIVASPTVNSVTLERPSDTATTEVDVLRQKQSEAMVENSPQWGSDMPKDDVLGLICKAKMVYDFEAAPGSQEMSAFAGEVIDIFEQQEDG